MASSSAARAPNSRAQATQSSMETPATGTNGQTSRAPMRGCSPWWRRMSMRACATRAAARAPSTTAAGSPTKVYTVRLVERPGSTSSSVQPRVRRTASPMASMVSRSRPSEKFGTHSTSLFMRSRKAKRAGDGGQGGALRACVRPPILAEAMSGTRSGLGREREAAAYANTRPQMPPGASTLPARYYTDPDHFRLEMEHIHFDMWLCAGRTEQLAAPGRYFVREVGNASVIVLGGEDGGASAFYNVCRHRGTRLCKAGEGELPGRIQCPYHAWTYGLDGRLLGAPHMDKVEGFAEADYPLQRVATAVWDGHVFINLSERPRPFAEHLASLPARFAPWGMADLRLVERRVYSLRANWK